MTLLARVLHPGAVRRLRALDHAHDPDHEGYRRPLSDPPPGTADQIRRGGDWTPVRPQRTRPPQ